MVYAGYLFRYIVDVPVHLPSWNPWRTSWNWRLALRCVCMSASTTFHMVSRSPMPRVSVIPLGMGIRTVNPKSCGISPVCRMCWTMSISHIQRSVQGEFFKFSSGYASRSHCLKCSARRWMGAPSLSVRWRRTAASNSASNGVCIVHLERVHMCQQVYDRGVWVLLLI